MRNLKLIWDFKGVDAQQTAQHHLIHLKEYIAQHSTPIIDNGVEVLNEKHSICYLALSEEYMPDIRDTLKPHRGQLWNA